MTGQDTTTCVTCGGALDFEPRLGDWILHERCRDAMFRHVNEGKRMGRHEAERDIVESLRASAKVAPIHGHALAQVADSIERGEHVA
jgi:hypothetical protein